MKKSNSLFEKDFDKKNKKAIDCLKKDLTDTKLFILFEFVFTSFFVMLFLVFGLIICFSGINSRADFVFNVLVGSFKLLFGFLLWSISAIIFVRMFK
jgi:hypothetical protein